MRTTNVHTKAILEGRTSARVLDVGVLSVLPSPYQRDLFAALAAQPSIALSVFYQEDAAPDSPWPDRPLAPYEAILPGRWVGWSPRRIHINWGLPDFSAFDVVILNTSYLSTATQWLMRWGLRDTPWVVWAEILRPQVNPIKEWGQRRLTAPFAEASAVVAIGQEATEAYRARFPQQQVVNIPYHCDLAPFQRAANAAKREDDGSVRVLCCGQMIYRKGIDVLLNAFEQVVDRGADVVLDLVGREGDLPEMVTSIQPSTRERIRFHGFQAPHDLPAFFACADLFVLPSRHDGWGVVVNQAIGAGLPIVATEAVGAAHDLISQGYNGLRVAPGAAEPLADALWQLISDAELRHAYGQSSSDMEPNWTPQAGSEKWFQLLSSVAIGREGL